MIRTREELTLVQETEDMDDETFVAHMNKRHRSSLGGLPYLWVVNAGMNDGAMRAWRAFHKRLHEIQARRYKHEHG